ncbi:MULTISPECIES: type II toxin-antitoxin system VapC family toxin [unclassified Roseofilum]|uniref:type II toxin-antitoxin system VapC family toxin n=1 Tax=unclassified Roseofilum TaxID=2620099 RepID=UPI001B016BAA|nr:MULTISPECIES: type II toxin-antitoxin system VapC family toxin [unclassified Roseofilum]MBP0007720.1 type II toxin-antitoxin system VapC family toxin [Roseofilum sp. Belize Diploria]MBP0031624.1 type II toxin-antitoxin system VapC family toxin [Roseofilum sp. Belize BBD 4]
MPEIILLDTHIWIWFVNLQWEQFPATWVETISTAELVAVASVSCYEVALAEQRGRLSLPCTLDLWFQEALDPSGISLFPLTPEIASRAVQLSAIHRDPFDRMIIATAIEYQAQLATIDGSIRRYPERTDLLM